MTILPAITRAHDPTKIWKKEAHYFPVTKIVNVKLTTPARHRTIGKANADSTIPVVKNAQASFKDDDVLPRSPDLLEIMVGMGANT